MNAQKLIRKVAVGDQEAFCELVKTYRNLVLNICYSFLNDREQAEEAAQDVFLQVYKQAGKFRGKSKLSTWIYRIAVNCAVSTRRRYRRDKTREIIQKKVTEGSLILEIPQIEAPDSRMENEEIRKTVRKALDSLPEKQRTVIILHKMEGMTSQEIAHILGISQTSVEARIHRAKLNLKKKLSRVFSNPGY